MLDSVVETGQDAAREVSSFFYRGIEKLYDRLFWKNEEDSGGKAFLKELLSRIQSESKRFPSEVVHLLQEEHVDLDSFTIFKKGFNSSTYTFMTHTSAESRKWIFKVGHRISPLMTFSDPAEKEYCEVTRKQFLILKEMILSHPSISSLLPYETVIEWLEVDKVGRTVMLQYFYEIQDRDDILALRGPIVHRLRTELSEVAALFHELSGTHNLYPDLLGSANLVVVRDYHSVDPHFILLDIGLMDFKHRLPITKKVMEMSLKKTIEEYSKLLS